MSVIKATESRVLFALISKALNPNVSIDNELFSRDISWSDICRLAARQGVLAIAWDGLTALHSEGVITTDRMPERAIKLQWALNVEKVEQRYKRQERLSIELSDAFAKYDIATFVLKGLAISPYYPTPSHRECGDLDCFLAATRNGVLLRNSRRLPVVRYDEGNIIAAQIGAKVDVGFYKHSHINYRGLMVENHQFCTAIRGSKQRKELERYLEGLILEKELVGLADSSMYTPSPLFNALFLTYHSFSHFLIEGIRLRHILDWALLLRSEQHNIDWTEFYLWCDYMHYTKFTEAMTSIAEQYLGFDFSCKAIRRSSKYDQRILEDILYDSKSIYNTKGSKLKKRLLIVRGKLLGNWKYRELYNRSALADTLRTIVAFFIEPKPKI